MKRTLITLTGLAAIAVAGAAIAQTGAERPWADKQFTRAEALARAEAAFARSDANKDGQLTPEELRAGREDRRAHRHERSDARLAEMTPEQRAEAEKRRAARKEARAEHRGEHPGKAGQDGKRGPRAAMFAEGPVTLDKFREQALQRFERADANRDGVVTADERKARRAGRHGGERHPR